MVKVPLYHLSSNLDGETVILNSKTGAYYGLNAVGSYIWSLIQEPKTVFDIHDALVMTYDVEPERCLQDLVALLQELADHGLVDIEDER
jgi:hypothetical protein